MKAAFISVGTALVASACCIGPVAFSVIGGARWALPPSNWSPGDRGSSGSPWPGGFAFYSAYRPTSSQADCEDGVCPPQSMRVARLLAWTAAILAAVTDRVPVRWAWC